ncbi:uncharacterized protein G2W53_001489 [Senna tora]|uniref:MULE transposase domain-containing protein n=1 Tax=Senna tora TaxID=362788 RepID=A0A834XG09_9FABA|nr:uncharacterized protein G2W53_001489 [Senna tora]
MVQVDGTFLYGKYIQTLLIASSQDGNSNIMPLAFAIMDGETLEAWAWFFRKVRLQVVGDRENICLISERHPVILSTVSDPRTMWQPPYSHHVYCIRHLASNLNKQYKDSWLKDLFINIDLHRMGVPCQTIINPRPEDLSLLTLQKKYISKHVRRNVFYDVDVAQRTIQDFHRLRFSKSLRTQDSMDVAILLGLPCVRVPVVGQTGIQWAEVYLGLLGHTPPPKIKWRPYDEDHVSQQIPNYCIDNRYIWHVNVSLIYFHIVEWQCSDRVLRQFGMDQPIPKNPVDIDFLHTLILAGKTSADWFCEHQHYIQVWNHWEARVAFAPPYHAKKARSMVAVETGRVKIRFHARADHMEFLQVIVRIFICQPSEFRKQMNQAQLQFKWCLKSSSSNTQWGLLYRWSVKLLQGFLFCHINQRWPFFSKES